MNFIFEFLPILHLKYNTKDGIDFLKNFITEEENSRTFGDIEIINSRDFLTDSVKKTLY